MGKLRFNISMSLDGYVAGPNQSLENPLGEGGEQLHEWVLRLKSWRKTHGMTGGETGPSDDVQREGFENLGAHIMGRNMFGGGPGPWKESWKGWWGDNPPFHHPVFVLTHHPREPLEMQGGTTFFFVTDGIREAPSRRSARRRGTVERFFDNLGGSPPKLEPVRTIEGPGVVHLKYRPHI